MKKNSLKKKEGAWAHSQKAEAPRSRMRLPPYFESLNLN